MGTYPSIIIMRSRAAPELLVVLQRPVAGIGSGDNNGRSTRSIQLPRQPPPPLDRPLSSLIHLHKVEKPLKLTLSRLLCLKTLNKSKPAEHCPKRRTRIFGSKACFQLNPSRPPAARRYHRSTTVGESAQLRLLIVSRALGWAFLSAPDIINQASKYYLVVDIIPLPFVT